MKTRAEIIINRPRQHVVDLITNPDNTSKWQSAIKTVELLSGEPDQEGSKSRVVFEAGGFRLELTETVIRHSPPDLFASSFEARGVKNVVENRFYEMEAGRTRWVMDNALHLGGIMSFAERFLRNLVAKQTVQTMKQFKSFAEATDVL